MQHFAVDLGGRKSQICVREAAQCRKPGEVGALLRREGIHSSHLSAWRRALETHGVVEHGRR